MSGFPGNQRLDPASPVICLRERLVYENAFIMVFADDVYFRDAGRPGVYVRVDRPGGLPGVVVLPLSGGDAGLVRVYRYPAGRWEWGLPRGIAHGPDPEATAREELLEELGAAPQWLTPLGQMTPDSGLLSSVVHMFAAGYDEKQLATADAGEVSAITWVPVPELMMHVASGDITDGFTLAALCCAQARGITRP
jgi:8-oxo-dGTP pyrophosphatase MutT (NUDIX family)